MPGPLDASACPSPLRPLPSTLPYPAGFRRTPNAAELSAGDHLGKSLDQNAETRKLDRRSALQATHPFSHTCSEEPVTLQLRGDTRILAHPPTMSKAVQRPSPSNRVFESRLQRNWK